MATDSSKIDLGEWIIIVMIGIEILLAVGTIGLTVHEANSQAGILSSILTAQARIDTDLNNMDTKLGVLDGEMATTAGAVTKSSDTSSKINAALRSQLRMLAEEQKQRLEQLSRSPKIEADVGDVPLDSPKQSPLVTKELSDSKAAVEIILWNRGNLALLGGLVRISTSNPNVKLTTTDPFSPILAPSSLTAQGNGILVPLSRLNRGVWMLILLDLEYPINTPAFRVDLTVDGDNLPLTNLGSMLITPPAAPRTP